MGLARNYLFIYPPDFIVLIVAGCHSQKERARGREREGGGGKERKREGEVTWSIVRVEFSMAHEGKKVKEEVLVNSASSESLWSGIRRRERDRERERNSATSTSRDYVMSVTRRFMFLIKLHRMIRRLNDRGGGTFRILVLLFSTLIFILHLFDTRYFKFCYFRAEVSDEFSLLIL